MMKHRLRDQSRWTDAEGTSNGGGAKVLGHESSRPPSETTRNATPVWKGRDDKTG